MTSVQPGTGDLHEASRHGLGTFQYLILRFAELLLIALVLAIFFTVTGLENVTVDPFLFSLAAAGGAGSLLGFCARAIFHGRTPWLRWTTALSALVFCLFLMGGFTRGFVGVSPVALPRPQPDWSAVALIVAGGVLAALSLAARKPRVLADASPAPIEEEASAARHANVRLVPGRADAPTKIRVPVLERIRVGIRGWKRRARKDEVRFVGAEEHRCPYCLQPIVNRDPRGVVTCPECHTRHHKDCWDITGMCQIPHYHS